MTDRGAENPDNNEGSIERDVAREWVTNRSDELHKAAEAHPGWARALEADSHLADVLAETAKLRPAIAAANFPTDWLMTPELQRSLDSITKLAGSHLLADSFKVPALEMAEKIGRRFAEVDPSIFDFSVGDSFKSWRAMLPELRDLQRSLNILNRPSATRETANFITATESLRFRGRQRMWHYTSAHALNQILNHGVLWASNPHHLNDASELTHGVELVDTAVDRAAARAGGPTGATLAALREVTDRAFVSDAMHEIFYISASSASDSLTLWRNYSTTDGFAIGLQPGKQLSAEGLVLPESDATSGSGLPTVANWYKVHYADRDKDRLADEFVDSATKDLRVAGSKDHALVIHELRKHLLVLASTMKHRAFEDEREVRWITTNWAPVDVVHYEVTGRGFVPVLHVRSVGRGDGENLLPITGLRCSPTTSPTIERTMSGLLAQRSYETASKDVKKSVLPFRG